jgi:hypothetical protein
LITAPLSKILGDSSPGHIHTPNLWIPHVPALTKTVYLVFNSLAYSSEIPLDHRNCVKFNTSGAWCISCIISSSSVTCPTPV